MLGLITSSLHVALNNAKNGEVEIEAENVFNSSIHVRYLTVLLLQPFLAFESLTDVT